MSNGIPDQPPALTPKEARQRLALSQQEVAVRAGIALGTVARAEQLGRWPTQPRVLRGLRVALGLPDLSVVVPEAGGSVVVGHPAGPCPGDSQAGAA